VSEFGACMQWQSTLNGAGWGEHTGVGIVLHGLGGRWRGGTWRTIGRDGLRVEMQLTLIRGCPELELVAVAAALESRPGWRDPAHPPPPSRG